MHVTRNQVDGGLSDEAEKCATMQTDERLQPSLASTQQRSYYVTWSTPTLCEVVNGVWWAHYYDYTLVGKSFNKIAWLFSA